MKSYQTATAVGSVIAPTEANSKTGRRRGGGIPQILGEEPTPSKTLVPSAPTLPSSSRPEPPREAHLPLPPAGLPRDIVMGQSCFPKQMSPRSSPAGMAHLRDPDPEPGHTIRTGLVGGVEVGRRASSGHGLVQVHHAHERCPGTQFQKHLGSHSNGPHANLQAPGSGALGDTDQAHVRNPS